MTASSVALAGCSLSLSPPSPVAEDVLTPTQRFLRRPSLPKRTVSDFSTSTDGSGTARRRRSLANGHAYRMRASRRPSTATSYDEKPVPARNTFAMVRSVSLPVATRTEFERQCQAQHERMMGAPGLQDPSASQVSWSFKWPTLHSHPSHQPGELSNRRLSSCSPFETHPTLQETDGFPWSAACMDMPGLSPSSSSISSSRAASSGPPSPTDGFAVPSQSRRTSTPSFSRGAMSAYSLTAKSSPGSSSPSPRSPLSPLSQRINLYNGPEWVPQTKGGGGRSLQLNGTLTSRRTSNDSYEKKKGAPYPSPQRRLSASRMLDFGRSESLGFGQDRRSSFNAPELAPHLEENESCPASPPRPFSQCDADQLVAKLEPLAITQGQAVSFGPLPAVAIIDDDEVPPTFAITTSAGFVAAEDDEEEPNDDGMLTPRAGSPLRGIERRGISTSEPGYSINKVQPSLLSVRMLEDRTVIPQTKARHFDAFDNKSFERFDCDVIITPQGERIVIHPDHHSLPPIPM
ncbi:hypothetical protein OC846_002542 [Tilletia horrida]|uniref:Uncharacterized protein n=1 Tax=Tilletia horrida TaxID=155126 RepID=A0AAN6JS22_9BASI|nr:hypothetical protein OC846_002542 [Tilletia horrida]